MSDTNTTPVTPAEEGCASWIDEMGDSAAVIKKIKRNNNFHRQSPEPGSSNPIELPQGIFREVPVHVTRTPNRSVKALPPPSAQPQVLPTRRKNEGRRRPKRLGGNGDGDDSGSDSGGDGRRNGRHSPDGPLQKRKPSVPPPPELKPQSRGAPSLKDLLANQKPLVLSPEEEERVRNLRRLNEYDKSLGTRLELRALNKADHVRKVGTLLREKRSSEIPSVAWDQIAKQRKTMNEYLDESLYSAIADDRLSGQIDKPDPQRVILDMIAETESRVIQILESALLLQGFDVTSQYSRPGLTLSFERGPNSQYPLPVFKFPYEVYGENLPAWNHVRIPPIPMLERRNGSPQEIYSHPLVSAYLRILMGCTPDGCIGGLPVSDILTYSNSGQLSAGYIASLRSLVGEPVFDSFVAQTLDRISRERLIAEYRERMKAINMRVSQEFFQRGSYVTLVLFNGGRPSRIEEVHPDDLDSMGWRLDGEFGRDQQGTERYWRYATAGHQTSLSNAVIDMVIDMDWNVLDAWERQEQRSTCTDSM